MNIEEILVWKRGSVVLEMVENMKREVERIIKKEKESLGDVKKKIKKDIRRNVGI